MLLIKKSWAILNNLRQDQNTIGDLVQMGYYERLNGVKKNIRVGVDVNAKAYIGHAPLMGSREGETQDIVKCLLSIGAKEKYGS